MQTGRQRQTCNYWKLRGEAQASQSSHPVDEKTAELPLLMGFSLRRNASQKLEFGFKTPPVAIKYLSFR